MQHTHPILLPPLPPPQHLLPPPSQLIAPPSTHQDAAHHIDNPHTQRQQASPLLPDRQKYRLDVKLEEDAGHGAFVDIVGLRGDGVLVCDDCVGGGGEHVRGGVGGGGFGGGGAGVDCGDDGEVVLILVEVGAGGGVGFVQGVEEGGVKGTEG